MDQQINLSNNPESGSKTDLTAYREQYSHYARRLLSDLGLGDLPQPERGQLLTAIESYVQQLLLNTLLENLDPQHIEAADKILKETNDQEEVMGYLLANVPNIELKMANALAESYAQMVAEARELAKAITTNQPPAVPSPVISNING